MEEQSRKTEKSGQSDSLGVRLKKARLEKGYTIEDIHQNLKINISYLQALEKDDYKILPPLSFSKVFIKSYGDFLGLDGVSLSCEFENEYSKKTLCNEEKIVIYYKKPISKKSVVVSILIVVLMVVLFYYWRDYGEVYDEDKVINKDTLSGSFIDNYQELTKDSAEKDEIESEEEPKIEVSPTERDEKKTHFAEIIPVDTLWLTIMIDNDSTRLKEFYFRSKKQLEAVSYNFKEELQIYAGNAAGLIVVIDSADTLKEFGPKGKTRRVKIDSNYFKSLKEKKSLTDEKYMVY